MDWNIPQILLSGIGGLIGATIGMLVYSLTKHMSKSTKYSIWGLLNVGLLVAMVILTNTFKAETTELLTCEICGYKTLLELGKECDVCVIEINDEYKTQESYVSIEELILEEQLYFFALEDEVRLFQPKIYKDLDLELHKDETWIPKVTQAEIEILNKEMDEMDLPIKIELIQ